MTTWTIEQKLEHLLSLPWTVVVGSEDDELVGRVSELQGVLATGATERELHVDLAESLEAVLSVMLDHGDPITPPAGTNLPWEHGNLPPLPDRVARIELDGNALANVRAQSSASFTQFAHA